MTISPLAETVAWVAGVLFLLVLIEAAADRFFRPQKNGDDLPHSYFTEKSREVALGKPCKCPVKDCVICGEGR